MNKIRFTVQCSSFMLCCRALRAFAIVIFRAEGDEVSAKKNFIKLHNRQLLPHSGKCHAYFSNDYEIEENIAGLLLKLSALFIRCFMRVH